MLRIRIIKDWMGGGITEIKIINLRRNQYQAKNNQVFLLIEQF